MEKAKVYFSDLRTSPTSNLLDKMERLLKRAGIGQLPLKDSFTAVKIHFGEPGNLAYIRPNYAARMAKTMEEVLERFRTIEFHDDFDMIVAIANGGIVPAGIINQRLQKEVHLLRINLRDEYQHPKYDAPQLLAPVDFNFRGKSILLVDDRIKTGATIKLARELLKEARSIKTFAVNGTADYALFDETCFKFPWIL